MIVESNKVVSIHYILTDDDNNILDQNSKEQPLIYLHGAGNVISGLEEALAGKTSGDQLKTRIEPEHAYGIRQEDKVQSMPIDSFQGVDKIEPGMQFHAAGANGENIVVTITQIEGDQVTIDGNHPLSGVALTFDVEILDIRDATAEELTHKHIHGPDCSHG